MTPELTTPPTLRESVTAADAAYTAAVSVAAGTGDWGPVQAAATVAKKARLNHAAAPNQTTGTP